MTQLAPPIETDIWVTGNWDEYLQVIDGVDGNFSHSYYHQGRYSIEMTPLGHDHGYEDLGVQEYWIVDVKNVNIIAFGMLELGSVRITRSQLLPGLEMSILIEALNQSRNTNQTQVLQWLMSKFQS